MSMKARPIPATPSRSFSAMLQIQHQQFRLCARHADHHLSSPLGVIQYQVAMIDLALQHPGAAGAAGAALATARDLAAMGADGLQDGGADRYREHRAAAAELNV